MCILVWVVLFSAPDCLFSVPVFTTRPSCACSLGRVVTQRYYSLVVSRFKSRFRSFKYKCIFVQYCRLCLWISGCYRHRVFFIVSLASACVRSHHGRHVVSPHRVMHVHATLKTRPPVFISVVCLWCWFLFKC